MNALGTTDNDQPLLTPRSLLAHTTTTVLDRVSAQQESLTPVNPKTGLNYILNDASHTLWRDGAETAAVPLGGFGSVVNPAIALLPPKSHANAGIYSVNNSHPDMSRPPSTTNALSTSNVSNYSSVPSQATPQGYYQMIESSSLPYQTESVKAKHPEHQSDRKRKRKFCNRTKTGCLTCRGRKKKCDERKPVCK